MLISEMLCGEINSSIQIPRCCVPFLWLIVLAVMSAGSIAAEQKGPEITSQGFDISDTQEGHLAAMGRLRIRFEVPARIAELSVKERSFEVDLAKTPEMKHYPLFGLERPVRQLTDVTLDFQRYIDEKIPASGDYEFQLSVTDRKGRTASAVLRVRILDTARESRDLSEMLLESARFRFVRAGAADASSAETFGISWRTLDRIRVEVELAVSAAKSGGFFELIEPDFDGMNSKSQLARLASNSFATPTLNLVAAGNGAAGRVFGVLRDQTPMIFRITRSHTELSEIGTTVTLEGEYKY